MKDITQKSDGTLAVTRKQAALEVSFLLGVGLTYYVSSVFKIPIRIVMVVLGLAIVGYGMIIWRRHNETAADFGVTTKNLAKASLATAAFTAFAALIFISYAWFRGESAWRSEMLITLPFYPIYGVAQQFMVQSIFHRRVLALTQLNWLSALITGLCFGAIHANQPVIWCITTVGGVVWALLFQRYRNLWPLGVSHGILGALAYPLLLNIDPLRAL